MKDQLKKRMFKKRIVRRLKLSITNKLSIDVNSYALIRPTLPGTSILIYFSLGPFLMHVCGFNTLDYFTRLDL